MFPDYDMPLFRPPSEARSLIFQITLGCSWNRCSFCQMYKTKKFRVRPMTEVLAEISAVGVLLRSQQSHLPTKVFLADGDAMALETTTLLPILSHLKSTIPGLRRVSSYALPRNILSKTKEQLQQLKQAGLDLLYVGIESGDDGILQRVRKGETNQTTLEALLLAKQAGFSLSTMILLGLGGSRLMEKHAIHSAQLINRLHPDYLATLVVSFPFGIQQFSKAFGNDYQQSSLIDLLQEMSLFLRHCQLENTIFRSDHASNYLVLKGILNRDQGKLLDQIERAIKAPQQAALRPEWIRGL